jgi:hypothetical protein
MARSTLTVDLSDETRERLDAALAKRRERLQEPATLTRSAFGAHLLALGLGLEEARPVKPMGGK